MAFYTDGSISGYRWYINGAQVSSSRDFSYDLGAGAHDIYLTVTDNEGAEGSVGASVLVTVVSTDNLSDGFDYPVGVPQRLGGTGYVSEENDGDGYYNAQDFGQWNEDYNGYHLGEDWNGEEGGDTDFGYPVYAISNGEVVYAQDAGPGWGNVIIIHSELPDGTAVRSMYAHLRYGSLLVNEGDRVIRGQRIGEIGKGYNGAEYDAHLHLEVRTDTTIGLGPGYSDTPRPGGWVDPSDFIDTHRPPLVPSNLYLDNSMIKVGVNLDYGGAITEISHNGFNLVDTHDLGRLIQVSLWDGDDPTWNPIQAGGISGQTNPVLEYDTESNLIYTKTQLIDWYTGELRDVYLEQWVTLLDQISGHDVNTVIEVRYKIIYTGDDYHAFWDQEFPCAYLNSTLNRLVWYQNDYPWTSDDVSIYVVPTDQANFEFYPTEYWAAFVNDQDFGLTLYSHDHTSKWAANRFTIDTQPSYLVTIDQFGIEPGTVEEATEYFVVGNYTDTREIIYLLNSCPTAQFTGDKTEGPKPLTVQFTDQSTGVIDSWYWAFGDGGTSTEQNPKHTYNSAGTFTVSLTVVDFQIK